MTTKAQEISMGEPPLDTRHPYVDFELQSEPFREFLRQVNKIRRKDGGEPLQFTAAGMRMAIDDYHQRVRHATPCQPREEAGLSRRGVPEIERLAELVLPKPGSRWIWQPDNPQYREDVEVEAVRWNGEEFWISTRGARRNGLTVVGETHHNELDHFLDSASPCPPAYPPSVSAAEETSSGEERCTAGGACCLPMILYRAVFPVPTRVTIKKYPEDEGVELPVERFCRWCGTKLNKET